MIERFQSKQKVLGKKTGGGGVVFLFVLFLLFTACLFVFLRGAGLVPPGKGGGGLVGFSHQKGHGGGVGKAFFLLVCWKGIGKLISGNKLLF